MGNLLAQPTAPVVEWESLEPVNMFTAPNGDLVADFGTCLAGVAEVTVQAPEATEVTLDFSEVLDERGDFFRNIMGRNKDQRDVFVCGPGETTFRPWFTYHGFRYMRIAGVTQDQIISVHAHALGTELVSTGRFSCSDERLNVLQRNIRRSERSNMLSVPTDCPQREKMGWTGDILVFAKTGCFNFDLSNFLSSWLGCMRLEQRDDGEVPMVVPTYPAQDRIQRELSGDNTSSAWGDACILVPLDLYRCYGDKRILRENLPMMRRWLGFIATAAARKPEGFDRMTPEQKARNPYLWTKGHHFGDWLIPSFGGQANGVMAGVAATYEVIGSCYYAVTVRGFLSVLDALLEDGPDESLESEREHYAALLAKIKQAVREEYISDDGLIRGDLMGMYVMALYADIVEGALRERLQARLARMVEENKGRLDTGFVSTPHLLDVLADAGRTDLAYRLLFQTQSPSWLYMVQQGATSIWENWEAIRPDGTVTSSSFNHYALGSVGDWVYRNIGGISPGAPGYRHIVFAPDFGCGLDHADCSVQTPYGEASCSWKRGPEGVSVEITVPMQATAELRLNGQTRELEGGTHRIIV
jgi:alpha-L-rhamnosidase